MKRLMILAVCVCAVMMVAMSRPVLAHVSYSGGTVNGGESVVVGAGLGLDPSETCHWFEIVGIDTSHLTPDVGGGFRLRLVQDGHSPIGTSGSTQVNVGVQVRTYPDSSKEWPGHGNPLVQTVEWISDPWGEWMDPTHSHGFNPGDVTAKYDLAWQMEQVVGGVDDGKWDILAHFRLTSGTGDWTSIYDGTQRTRYAYQFGDGPYAYLRVEAGDGFTGGYATYDGITTNANPIPEPISMIFFGTGVVGVLGYISRRRMRSRD